MTLKKELTFQMDAEEFKAIQTVRQIFSDWANNDDFTETDLYTTVDDAAGLLDEIIMANYSIVKGE